MITMTCLTTEERFAPVFTQDFETATWKEVVELVYECLRHQHDGLREARREAQKMVDEQLTGQKLTHLEKFKQLHTLTAQAADAVTYWNDNFMKAPACRIRNVSEWKLHFSNAYRTLSLNPEILDDFSADAEWAINNLRTIVYQNAAVCEFYFEEWDNSSERV